MRLRKSVVQAILIGEAVLVSGSLAWAFVVQPELRDAARSREAENREQRARGCPADESAYNPGVCSAAGACGLTQLMPATARELGVLDRFDPVENLRGGADYLARQLVRFGDLKLPLAAYNSGPSRVARLGRIPEITETQ